MEKTKAIIGYGLAIFDSDLNFDRDNIDFCDIWDKLWEITKDADFIKFSDSLNVSIKEWKCEDCTQMWIVDKLTYTETTSFAFLGQFIPIDKSKIEEVSFELFRRLKEETGWITSYDGDCEWGLHLYYE